MRTFRTWRDPYDAGFATCHPKEITINDGVTILIGCNGAGKTTLLHNIESNLRKDGIPFAYYDNLSDGGHESIESAAFEGDFSLVANLNLSSEGEAIGINLGNMLSKIKRFLSEGKYFRSKFEEAMFKGFSPDYPESVKPVPNERWILLDAIDSGYSIDNVIDLKRVFDLILADGRELGLDVYIVASANEYELVNGSSCFDVNAGKYIDISSYDQYKNFIINSRKLKDNRIERANKKRGES